MKVVNFFLNWSLVTPDEENYEESRLLLWTLNALTPGRIRGRLGPLDRHTAQFNDLLTSDGL